MAHDVQIITPDFERVVSMQHGATILQAIHQARIDDFHAPCGGSGRCGKCRVSVSGKLSPSSDAELTLLHDAEKEAGVRLACQAIILGNVVVRVQRAGTASILSSGSLAGFPIDAAAPGKVGAGIDVGTTTIVAHLVELSTGKRLASIAEMNAQRSYGEDVLARIDAAGEIENGVQKFQSIVTNQITSMIIKAFAHTGLSPNAMARIVVAGNPTMLHFFAGVSPQGIATAPFIPQFTARQVFLAREARLENIPEDVNIMLLPGISAYVGADIVAGIAASGMSRKDEMALYIDLGTNGEMALGNAHRIFCCAAAAGPAFDGGGFTWGTGGILGAIDSVWLDDTQSEIGIRRSTIGGAEPNGLCGSGILDAASVFLECGIIDETGRLADEETVSRLSEPIARFVDVRNKRAYIDLAAGIYITQAELRQIQLAKAAISAGLELLLREADFAADDIERLYLAGGFGSSLDPESAARIGLIPKSLCNKVMVVGNASGEGAVAACLSREAVNECDRIAELCDYIELSNRADFTRAFVEHMEFGFYE